MLVREHNTDTVCNIHEANNKKKENKENKQTNNTVSTDLLPAGYFLSHVTTLPGVQTDQGNDVITSIKVYCEHVRDPSHGRCTNRPDVIKENTMIANQPNHTSTWSLPLLTSV